MRRAAQFLVVQGDNPVAGSSGNRAELTLATDEFLEYEEGKNSGVRLVRTSAER
jgi:hypothetical protein